MDKKLTAEYLTDVRKRIEYAKEYGHDVGKIALDDAPKLIDEVIRLKEDNDRLRERLAHIDSQIRSTIIYQSVKDLFE